MMASFSKFTIAPTARVVEPTYLDIGSEVLGLRIVCTWAQWLSQSSIHVYRDLEDEELELKCDELDALALSDVSSNKGIYLQHSNDPTASLRFNPQQDVLWLSPTMTIEPHLIQCGLRQAYGSAVDAVENIIMTDWCWREQSVPVMAKVLDVFCGLQSVTLVLDQDEDMSDEEAGEMKLGDLFDISPRPWSIQYVECQGPRIMLLR